MALVIAERLRPCSGFHVCGDGILVRRRAADTLLALSDGVGHGPHAAAATDAILAFLQHTELSDLSAILAGCDQAAAGTRGSALSLVLIAHEAGPLFHVGVGNVQTSLWTPGLRSSTLFNHNGMVGRLHKMRDALPYPTENHQLLVMHSDGISSRAVYAEMQQWDGNLEEHADRLMAHAVGRDDASLLLAQINYPSWSGY